MSRNQESVARRNKSRAYDGIIDLVVGGDLRLEEKISELAIGEKLGISRTPIREALAVLAHEGVITQRPQVGTYVNRVTSDEMAQTLQISQAIEALAVENLAKIGIDHNSTQIGDAFERLTLVKLDETADTPRQDDLLKADTELHEAIGLNGGMPLAVPVIALCGLKRRLFHLENPISPTSAHQILSTNGKLLNELLQAPGANSAKAALGEYYAVQLSLSGVVVEELRHSLAPVGPREQILQGIERISIK